MTKYDAKILTEKGETILKRGGADNVSDDDMLVLEIVKHCPGISAVDAQTFFVAMRMEYGEDALKAMQSGHVRFEKRKPQ